MQSKVEDWYEGESETDDRGEKEDKNESENANANAKAKTDGPQNRNKNQTNSIKVYPIEKKTTYFYFLWEHKSQNAYIFDPTLVRGCDYYTSTIFEVSVTEPKIGAIGGGGRYDNLIETLGGPSIPAVGFSFGFDYGIGVNAK